VISSGFCPFSIATAMTASVGSFSSDRALIKNAHDVFDFSDA